MQHYKIIIAYDGTKYVGWQVQPTSVSVAQCLQDVFFDVFGTTIVLYGVSRTDAGVHALGQVATFKTDLSLTAECMLRAWNARLPLDICIREIESVPAQFNPHAHVDYKTYWYHFFNERPLPRLHRHGWYLHYPVDMDKLERCLQVFVGTHDFRSFCTGDEHDDTVRTINQIHIERADDYQAYRIVVKGPKFLRYMIRRIVGASIYVASKKNLTEDRLVKALADKNPQQSLPNAPPCGLTLYQVTYKKI